MATGKRLYTLGESTDWVYAVAWSPDGKHLAAAGVDKSIRVWEVDRRGRQARALRLRPRGAGHPAGLRRRRQDALFARARTASSRRGTPPAWSSAWSTRSSPKPSWPWPCGPIRSRLALGRYDGVAGPARRGDRQGAGRAAAGQAEAAGARASSSPPRACAARPCGSLCEGKHLDGGPESISTMPGVTAELVPSEGRRSRRSVADVTIPADDAGRRLPARASRRRRARRASCRSSSILSPQSTEVEPNDSPRTGQKVTLPATVVGSHRPGRRRGLLPLRGEGRPGGRRPGADRRARLEARAGPAADRRRRARCWRRAPTACWLHLSEGRHLRPGHPRPRLPRRRGHALPPARRRHPRRHRRLPARPAARHRGGRPPGRRPPGRTAHRCASRRPPTPLRARALPVAVHDA